MKQFISFIVARLSFMFKVLANIIHKIMSYLSKDTFVNSS